MMAQHRHWVAAAAALLACAALAGAAAAAGGSSKPAVIAALEAFPDYGALVDELTYNGVAEEMEERSASSTLLALNNASIAALRCQGFVQDEIADILRQHVLVDTYLTMEEVLQLGNTTTTTTTSAPTLYYYYDVPPGSDTTNTSTNNNNDTSSPAPQQPQQSWVNLTAGGVVTMATTPPGAAPAARITGALADRPRTLSVLRVDAALVPPDVAAALPPGGDLVAAALQAPSGAGYGTFSRFLALARATGVDCDFQAWARNGPALTVWAPTDAAFARPDAPAIPGARSPLQVAQMVAFHSVRYYLNLSTVDARGARVPSYGGFCAPSTLFIAASGAAGSANGSTVTVEGGAGVRATVLGALALDGVAVYAVDRVLVPDETCAPDVGGGPVAGPGGEPPPSSPLPPPVGSSGAPYARAAPHAPPPPAHRSPAVRAAGVDVLLLLLSVLFVGHLTAVDT